jgi:hypothetical protein
MFKSWVPISSLIALGCDPWCSSCYRSSMAILLFRFCWSTSSFCSSSLATLRWPPYSSQYAKTFVFDLEFFKTLMLLSFHRASPYAFKMLMKDFKLSLSQFGSFDMLKEFCLWMWKIGLRSQTLPCEFGKLIMVGIGCAGISGENWKS